MQTNEIENVGTFFVETNDYHDLQPCVSVEFVPNKLKQTKSTPKAIFKYDEDAHQLELLIWANPEEEDFSGKLIFDLGDYVDYYMGNYMNNHITNKGGNKLGLREEVEHLAINSFKNKIAETKQDLISNINTTASNGEFQLDYTLSTSILEYIKSWLQEEGFDVSLIDSDEISIKWKPSSTKFNEIIKNI